MKQLFSVLFLFVFVSGLALAQDTPTLFAKGQPQVNPPDLDVLYDQTAGVGTVSEVSQNFEASFDTYDCQGADDFEVPAGETWTIESIDVPGAYFNGVGPANSFNVWFYNDAAGLPGTEAASALNASYTDPGGLGAVTVMMSPAIVLPEGSYWVSVQANIDFGVGGEWGWTEHLPINTESTWQNPGGGFGLPCPTWGYRVTSCGLVGTAGYTDFAFRLNGTSGGGGGFAVPEVLYYIFDDAGMTTTPNYAVPGRGSATATLEGAMSMGPTGQFGAALIGSGGSSSTDYVNTGWATDIGASDWTISLWLSNLLDVTNIHYLFGDGTASSFRCFYNGIAPTGGVVLRGTGIIDVPVTGVQPGPTVVHFVYDATVPEIRAYVNGVFQSAVSQSSLNLNGSGPFKVGGEASSVGLEAGGLLDEFRFYERALGDAEIAETWNISIIPVELTSFTASATGTNVKLLWETATELNNSGFSIERKSTGSDYMEIGFVPGFGTTTEPKSYSFNDQNLRSGVYTYRLKQVDFDGSFTYSNEVEVEVIAPAEFSLDQNYPNPFNPSTKITFSLATDSRVSLKVFDVIGQEVASLINQELTAGVHNIDFNAAGINSGVYFYRIEASGVNGAKFVDVKKMILLK
jgi:hypothetical protein